MGTTRIETSWILKWRWGSSFIRGLSQRHWINEEIGLNTNIQNYMWNKKFWIKIQLVSCHQRNPKLDFKYLIQFESTTKCCKKSVNLIFLIFNWSRRQFTTSSHSYPNLKNLGQHHSLVRNSLLNLLRKWLKWAKFMLEKVLRTRIIFIGWYWRSMSDFSNWENACCCINKLTWW